MRTFLVYCMSSAPSCRGRQVPLGHLRSQEDTCILHFLSAFRLAWAPLFVSGSSQLGRLRLSRSGAHCQAPPRNSSGLDKTPCGCSSHSRSRPGVSRAVSHRLRAFTLALLVTALPRLRPRVDPPRRARSLQCLGTRFSTVQLLFGETRSAVFDRWGQWRSCLAGWAFLWRRAERLAALAGAPLALRP